ncbi:hypothetical protein CQ393_07340 [Stenotrophomonas sp. MYb238]|nr:hypothetical protein [Stenotrophomonas sp. MYb238]
MRPAWEVGNGKWEMGNGKWEMGNHRVVSTKRLAHTPSPLPFPPSPLQINAWAAAWCRCTWASRSGIPRSSSGAGYGARPG